jgi:hypothetical protein
LLPASSDGYLVTDRAQSVRISRHDQHGAYRNSSSFVTCLNTSIQDIIKGVVAKPQPSS